MANRIVSVVEDNEVTENRGSDFQYPVIERAVTLNKTVRSENSDDFAKKAEELKSLDGVNADAKRRITYGIKKFRTNVDESAGSKAIHEKTFLTGYDAFDVVEPAYNLDYLAKLYEISPPHYAAVNAKVANIVGLGYKFVENAKTKRNFESMADDEEKTKTTRKKLNRYRDDLHERIEDLNEDDSFTETLMKVWRDYETMGNGYIEIGRKKDGSIGYVGHIPAQTVRIRRKRDGFVQISGFEVQFFSRFGKADVNPIGSDTPNEIIHIKKYSPTSGYYGVPDIVAAKQAVAGNEFAARFNLDYFENKAVPRHVIILKGAQLGTQAETALLSFFETSLKGQNHRSLYIPLPGDTPDNKVELKIEPVEAGVQDASFVNYRKANLSDIMMAHRVPISKVSTAEGASLALARDADKTFKEQVCAPEQKVMEKKLNKIVKQLNDSFELKLNEMTLTDENTLSQIEERRRKTGVETANEQRARRGDVPIEGGDELYDMNAAVKVAEMSDETTRRGQDKAETAARAAAAAKPTTGPNPVGSTERASTRSANATDSAGESRNPKVKGEKLPK